MQGHRLGGSLPRPLCPRPSEPSHGAAWSYSPDLRPQTLTELDPSSWPGCPAGALATPSSVLQATHPGPHPAPAWATDTPTAPVVPTPPSLGTAGRGRGGAPGKPRWGLGVRRAPPGQRRQGRGTPAHAHSASVGRGVASAAHTARLTPVSPRANPARGAATPRRDLEQEAGRASWTGRAGREGLRPQERQREDRRQRGRTLWSEEGPASRPPGGPNTHVRGS